jgi:hypothetical protein
MNSKLNLSHPGHPRHDTTPRTAPAIFAALVVALVCVLAAAYGYGRTAQEVATRADAAAIVSENHAFCTELGLLPQSDAYSKCVLGLAEVRRHTEERASARAAGML